MHQYMRPELEDLYHLQELQDKILEIMVYVDNVCRENHIDYCLMGGSALGAKRHGGFIPWDDDLDIFMTPSNYERFRTLFAKRADAGEYYLQEWGLTDGMVTISKVRKNGTAYLEPDFKTWDMHHGIYIDIFILHTCPKGRLGQLWQCFWGKYVITKGLALRNGNRHRGLKGTAVKLAGLLPERFGIKFGLKQVYRYRNQETGYYCNFLGKAFLKNAIYKKEYFAKTVYAPFEKTQLRVPEKLHEFLTERFGDYQKIPSPEQIKWEQHAEQWETERDFRELVANVRSFADERKLI